jgi:uncharacterized membrane protein YccC
MESLVPRRVRLQVLFSVNCFVAAMLALYIGFSIGLPRPYWAMSTVYITSQPLSGALRSKGIYRLIGTLVGASAAVAIVSVLNASPELLSLGLASWVGICLYISLLDRTPRSYVFLLAGYTAAIIGFPSAPQPSVVFDVAIARMEEIGLGVVCATIVHTLILPQGVGPALNRRIEGWLTDGRAWTLDTLTGRHDPKRTADRQKLATDAGEIRLLATHLPFDTSNIRETSRVVRALQDRMTMLLPIVSAVGDRLDSLRAQGPLEPELDAMVQEAAAWAGDTETTRAQTDQLAAKFGDLAPPLNGAATWREVLKDNLIDRMRLLLGAVQDVRDLRSSLRAGVRRVPAGLDPMLKARSKAPLYRDRYLAMLSALAASGAVLVCCVLWIVTGWTEGAVAALSAAVFCSFFATQDDPAPAIANFLWYTIAGLPLVALYEFVILPACDGFPMLALALSPSLLVLGYFVANPKTFGKALPMALGLANGLALTDTFSADFAGFVNSNVAQIIGLTAALFVTRLFRSVGADWSAWRILREAWRHIAYVASANGAEDQTTFATVMLDRVGLFTQRLALIPKGHDLLTVDALKDLRVGINTQELQRVRPALNGAGGAETRLLRGIAAHYHRLANGHGDKLDLTVASGVLVDLDAALACATRQAPNSTDAIDGVRVLVALRRNLFPEAAPYAAEVAA